MGEARSTCFCILFSIFFLCVFVRSVGLLAGALTGRVVRLLCKLQQSSLSTFEKNIVGRGDDGRKIEDCTKYQININI